MLEISFERDFALKVKHYCINPNINLASFYNVIISIIAFQTSVNKMQQVEASALNKSELKISFTLYSGWSFIALCRPQDYFPILAVFRPSLTLGLITFIVYLLHVKNHQSVLKSDQFKLFLFLVIIMLIGVPFSFYRKASLLVVFDYISIGLLFFILSYHIVNTVQRLKSLLLAYCCGVSIYAINILVFGRLLGGRVAFGTMFDPNDIAFFIINFCAFNLLFVNNKSTIFLRVIVIINIIIGLLVLFKTGSRSGFLACFVVFAYLLFKKTRTINISFPQKAFVIFIAFISLWSFSMNTERYKSILELSEDYNVTNETGRIAIWKTGMRLMMSDPLTGTGMGRFYEGVGRDRQERGLPSARWQAAHNSFVQIGAEVGVIGLILFTLMSYKVFIIARRVIDQSRSEDLVKISEMVRAGFLGHLVSAMFLSQAYSIYWLFYIALSAILQRLLEEEQA